MVGLLYLINGVLGYFVSTAVRKRRVISFTIPLRHGTILMTLMLALAVPIVHMHEFLSHDQEKLHLAEWIWPFVVAPIALLLLRRLDEEAVELIDRVCNRRYRRAKERLRHAAKAMQGAASPDEIDRLRLDECAAALRLASAALLRRHGGGAEASPPASPCGSRAGNGGGPACLPARPLPASPCRSPATGARRARSHCSAGTDVSADKSAMLREIATRAAEAYARAETDLLRRKVEALGTRLARLEAPAG